MGREGMKYSSGVLSGARNKLRAASDRVEDAPGAPPDPDAGEATGDVLRVLGILSGGAAKVAEGLAEVSNAVASTSGVYRTNERNQAARAADPY